MVINFWASKGHCQFVDPSIVAKHFADYGGRVCFAGSKLSQVPVDKFKTAFGIVLKTDVTEDQVLAALKKGYPCVISAKGYNGYNFKGQKLTGKYKGHFTCLTGIDEQGRIRINDSGNNPVGGAGLTAFEAGKRFSACAAHINQMCVIYPANMESPV